MSIEIKSVLSIHLGSPKINLGPDKTQARFESVLIFDMIQNKIATVKKSSLQIKFNIPLH